ncbi:hypothetical protein FACS189491_01800 [Spirochaetia bacterium]|nr:hypothetical protein FACS189491_01800 [Spirochaetia bacterium]
MKKSRIAVISALLLLAAGAAFAQEAGDFETEVIDGTITITGYTGSAAKVRIPKHIDGLPVTAIGAEAFDSCTGLESVTIPKGVTIIGDSAFGYCENLTAITIPKGVTTIGNLVFNGCKRLTAITIPAGVIAIGAGAFWNCESLASVELPGSVTAIGIRAFAGCHSLAKITIPAGVTVIREATFEECTGLTSITIPAGIKVIERQAFEYCEKLARVSLSTKTRFGRRVFPDTAAISYYDDPTGAYAAEKEARDNTVKIAVAAEARLVPEDIDIFFDAWIALLDIMDKVEEDEEWQDYLIALDDVDMSDEVEVFRETFEAFYHCPAPEDLENIFKASGWEQDGSKKYSIIIFVNHIYRLTQGVLQQYYGIPAGEEWLEEMLKEMVERNEALLRIFHPDDVALVISRFDDLEARKNAFVDGEE